MSFPGTMHAWWTRPAMVQPYAPASVSVGVSPERFIEMVAEKRLAAERHTTIDVNMTGDADLPEVSTGDRDMLVEDLLDMEKLNGPR